MPVTIYHNPRCSKSRQTLELLRERGIEPEIIEYLKTPPSEDDLETILEQLGMDAEDLVRKNESEFKDLGLDERTLSDGDFIRAMTEHPKLIQRPIVITEKGARLGRPPESVLEIL